MREFASSFSPVLLAYFLELVFVFLHPIVVTWYSAQELDRAGLFHVLSLVSIASNCLSTPTQFLFCSKSLPSFSSTLLAYMWLLFIHLFFSLSSISASFFATLLAFRGFLMICSYSTVVFCNFSLFHFVFVSWHIFSAPNNFFTLLCTFVVF